MLIFQLRDVKIGCFFFFEVFFRVGVAVRNEFQDLCLTKNIGYALGCHGSDF